MIDSLEELFVEEIKDLYHAEKQLLDMLPRMSAAASSKPLRQALDGYANEALDHVARLEKVFKLVGKTPDTRKCRAMVGLIAETDEMLEDCKTPEVRDAALIASAQRIKHYEMAGYGAARTHAETLGVKDAAGLLQQTLDDEGRADHALADLAKSTVNRRAATIQA